MTEIKITKVKYVIQYKTDDLKHWQESDWNNGIKYKSDLDNMRQMLERAKENNTEYAKTLGLKTRYYRLVKQTHSITTEVVDE